jgi:hypothetical protein
MAPVLSRRERDRSLSHRSKLLPVMITTVRLFNPYVTSIVGEKLFQKELDELSNVIKDNRAKLGSMREKTDHTKSSADNEERDEPTLSRLVSSAEPAPIDIIAFGRRDHRQPAGLRTSTLPIEIMN